MSIIRDPSSNKGMSVNNEGQGVVRAITQTEIEHASVNGDTYTWVSSDTDIDIGDTRLYIRNDIDTPLVFDRAILLPGNVASDWSFNLGTEITTPTSSTVVTGVNLTQSGNIAGATAFDDETAVADGTPFDYAHIDTVGTVEKKLCGVILKKGHYLQINLETETTSGRVIVYGHFENPS